MIADDPPGRREREGVLVGVRTREQVELPSAGRIPPKVDLPEIDGVGLGGVYAHARVVPELPGQKDSETVAVAGRIRCRRDSDRAAPATVAICAAVS